MAEGFHFELRRLHLEGSTVTRNIAAALSRGYYTLMAQLSPRERSLALNTWPKLPAPTCPGVLRPADVAVGHTWRKSVYDGPSGEVTVCRPNIVTPQWCVGSHITAFSSSLRSCGSACILRNHKPTKPPRSRACFVLGRFFLARFFLAWAFLGGTMEATDPLSAGRVTILAMIALALFALDFYIFVSLMLGIWMFYAILQAPMLGVPRNDDDAAMDVAYGLAQPPEYHSSG